ncbi:MAG TPA: DNA-processing protein DprA [bacterium]|nr:DNA-processing protein DprA [bacterium]HQO34548.1 DNA-processing protein DprA [bacterium]HQP98986.1 DNA-processing protein DprA [bacterium]
MNPDLPPNTQAILLLTAPLILGRGEPSGDLLTPGEFKKLARLLRENELQPGDLLAPDSEEVFEQCRVLIDTDRMKRLLDRGFLLSQAVERWQTRAIWVMSSTDDGYPSRLKMRMEENAPPILYGCGDAGILDSGGLAVVGSRNVGDALVEYTTRIGRLAAEAGCSLISGGARGIDRAAMRGALEAGGNVAGVLADSLERAVLNRENRDLLMENRLVLVSPFDPLAIFNVGYAMHRNKLIYALADAALVVSSDYEKGGTWAGAVEQLEKFRFVPVYVRADGESGREMQALQRKGARPWPNPDTPEALRELLTIPVSPKKTTPEQDNLFSLLSAETKTVPEIAPTLPAEKPCPEPSKKPVDDEFARAREMLMNMPLPKTVDEVAEDLKVSKYKAGKWLRRLVEEGVLEKRGRPLKYGPKISEPSLLE